MKRVYFAYSMTNSSQYLDKIHTLADSLEDQGLKVTQPSFNLFPELVVQRTLNEIQKSDLVIADLSVCSHGVGFELGYAYSLNKKVILIAESEMRNSISKFIHEVFEDVLFYSSSYDLLQQISDLLSSNLPNLEKNLRNLELIED